MKFIEIGNIPNFYDFHLFRVCYVYLLPLLGRAVVQEELPTTILFLSQAVFIVINQDVMMTLKHTYHWEFFKMKFILGITRYYMTKSFFQHIVCETIFLFSSKAFKVIVQPPKTLKRYIPFSHLYRCSLFSFELCKIFFRFS